MKIYSDYPVRRALQIASDVLAITAVALGIWLGTIVTSAISVLAVVGRQLESAGAGFKGAMTDAGNALGHIPFVGTSIRVPFDAASGTGGMLEDAGNTTASFITTTAMIVGIVVAGVIVLAVCWWWLRRRIRFARRATEANRLARLEDGPDLLALRALVNGSRKDIAATSAHPVDAWRAGHRDVIVRLAELELRDAGVRIAR
ncbi:MAG: hypothetical protein ABI238_04255 [Terrimesophilobacter sp.]